MCIYLTLSNTFQYRSDIYSVFYSTVTIYRVQVLTMYRAYIRYYYNNDKHPCPQTCDIKISCTTNTDRCILYA